MRLIQRLVKSSSSLCLANETICDQPRARATGKMLSAPVPGKTCDLQVILGVTFMRT